MSEDERLEAIKWLATERNLALGPPYRVSDDELMVAMFQELKALLAEKRGLEDDLSIASDTSGY